MKLLGSLLVLIGIYGGTSNLTRKPLHFSQQEKFKILILTDLHFGENSENDVKSVKVMENLLKWENPEFVVFTGDLISEEYLVESNGTKYIEMLLSPLVNGNYKWASTYGNHDSGILITREDILATEQQYPNAYTVNGGPNLPGITNYFVPVYPFHKDNENSIESNPEGTCEAEPKPSIILWFFDSRGGRKQGGGGFPMTVDSKVIEWFRNESEVLREKYGPIPSYAFFHYPTKEYLELHQNLKSHPECSGQRDDIVNPQDPDTELIRALAHSGMVKATFVGHNHANGWCCNYGTMVLCYNRQSGHGGGWKGWVRGGRVLDLSSINPWGSDTNYVRLENGSLVDYFPSL